MIDQVRKQTSEEKLKNGYQRRRAQRSNITENKVIFDDYQEFAAEAISALPPKRRQVFLLSREQGLSYKEIAERLGISKNTVEIHMVKAMKSLHQYLDPLIQRD